MEKMLKYDYMKYRHRLLYYIVAPIYIRYTLYTTKKKTKLTNVILFVFVFFYYTPALKALVSAKVSILFS
jgi:hypothetical protein